MGVLKNAALAASTAARHLSDDPTVLALQLSRRLPARFVQPAAKAVNKALPRSVSAVALIAAHVAGDSTGLERRFETARRDGVAGNRARLVADVALAAGQPAWADEFLPAAAGASRLPATFARRKWYDGDMSGAVAALAAQRGALGRHHDRLAGELRTFTGWTPVLPAVQVEAVPGRVLHFLTNSLPHTASGYAQRGHSILAAQRDAGWDVLAVTRLGYPVQVGKILAGEQDVVDGVKYRRLLPSRMAATADARMQQEAEELLRVAVEFRPQVLHTTTHFANALVVGAVARALGIPWVYEVRGQLADTWASTRSEAAKGSQRYTEFQAREADAMRSADVVFTLGETMKESIVAAGVPAEKVLLAPNAVGGEFLQAPRAAEEARTALGLDPDLNYIGTVSSLVDYEGIDDLVEAFALLAPEIPKLRLLIVGNGTSLPALQDQAKRLGLAQKAIFTGRVPRESTPLYHGALDVFVVPRKDLSVTRAVTPLKPVEALASARPVVASDLPALREIIEPDVNGRLSAADNPADLASVLSGLLREPELRTRLGLSGRGRVLETRTWAANAAAYSAAYKKVIDGSVESRSGTHD
ncbi:glycosyltransferase family 4 protein [Arthrobacter sp. H35-D1]|uniref:glycosyltransferase family 4 protein n=1 Tax=Arthrobacter sp. H35-D1 TaxID=3046202 RepID=UPI0024BBDDED|nr:glycosyltransferase family 4 protein [Arthrobacter sp. H35-D1]MDJ0314934.1 glycosyltransferase family 4 protein [Arthrobacter sp. H35-D1]